MGSDPLFRQERLYGAVRTALIGFGAVALTFFQVGSSRGLMVAGIALQAGLMLARALIKRYLPDLASSAQAMLILEVIADGVTVLLFALATFGAMAQVANDL